MLKDFRRNIEDVSNLTHKIRVWECLFPSNSLMCFQKPDTCSSKRWKNCLFSVLTWISFFFFSIYKKSKVSNDHSFYLSLIWATPTSTSRRPSQQFLSFHIFHHPHIILYRNIPEHVPVLLRFCQFCFTKMWWSYNLFLFMFCFLNLIINLIIFGPAFIYIFHLLHQIWKDIFQSFLYFWMFALLLDFHLYQ